MQQLLCPSCFRPYYEQRQPVYKFGNRVKIKGLFDSDRVWIVLGYSDSAKTMSRHIIKYFICAEDNYDIIRSKQAKDLEACPA